MKKFMLLHMGFEKPTDEIMARWRKWFDETAHKTIDAGGFRNGREISRDGTSKLPMDREAITGYTIIDAESLEEAEKIAKRNPYIAGIRVYEIMSM